MKNIIKYYKVIRGKMLHSDIFLNILKYLDIYQWNEYINMNKRLKNHLLKKPKLIKKYRNFNLYRIQREWYSNLEKEWDSKLRENIEKFKKDINRAMFKLNITELQIFKELIELWISGNYREAIDGAIKIEKFVQLMHYQDVKKYWEKAIFRSYLNKKKMFAGLEGVVIFGISLVFQNQMCELAKIYNKNNGIKYIPQYFFRYQNAEGIF